MARLAPGRVVTFGQADGADLRLTDLELDRLGRPAFRLAGRPVRLRLVGAHQALNAAAAAAAATAVGLELDRVVAALDGVAALSKWRMELHELPGGVILLNDSYNANPESMRAAIDALASLSGVRRRVAVLGVMLELGADSDPSHRDLGEYAAQRVDQLVVVGRDAEEIHRGGGGVLVGDNDEAVAWLREHLREGDAVLVKASRGARLDEVAAALQ
jgi:UDP-N-acetylmuramoyl-tripeptide--D-alanyl-D-alanine ligase